MMWFLGLPVDIKNRPELDPGFIPLAKVAECFEEAAQSLSIAIERNDGFVSVQNIWLFGKPECREVDLFFAERTVKSLLWAWGGYKVTICGSRHVYEHIATQYRTGGARSFDADFMANVYDRPFCVEYSAHVPDEKRDSRHIGGHVNGCRIGFDAGGSFRKVSAVIDGKCVYSEDVEWQPKLESNPQYHLNEILSSLRSAAKRMPRVDGIGISSAGIFIQNSTRVASLFLKVPPEKYSDVRSIYTDAAAAMGNVPVTVANDGDVAALWGARMTGNTRLMGIAMGTSEAAGYVDAEGGITGWLNELAFVPMDACAAAATDEWSGDIGVGCKYLSQDAVVKLMPAAGIDLPEEMLISQKVRHVAAMLEEGHERAVAIYSTIGCYLAHALAWYSRFYEISHVLLLGGVTSGKGGDVILSNARRVLMEDYPALVLTLAVPDERMRRVGLSTVAASL